MHPILESLVGTEREWLKNLLFAFNSGDIGKFEALAPHFAHEVNSQSYVSVYRDEGIHAAKKTNRWHLLIVIEYFAIQHDSSSPKDLPDVVDRDRVQAQLGQPIDPIRHHFLRDQAAIRRGTYELRVTYLGPSQSFFMFVHILIIFL